MNKHSAYRKFAAMMLQEDSAYIPQILKCMINDAQAELLVSLPGTAAQIAEKLDRAVDAVQADLNDLFRKGLAFKKEKAVSVRTRERDKPRRHKIRKTRKE